MKAEAIEETWICEWQKAVRWLWNDWLLD